VDLMSLIAAARGDQPADLLIVNGRLINVYTGQVEEKDIAIAKDRVVGFGRYEATRIEDLGGRWVAPGFIDAHVHIESTMTGISEFAQAVLPFGTTAVVADPHEIVNVLGAAGIEYMLSTSEDQPVKFFFALPSCVPATHLETAGAALTAKDMRTYMSHPRVVALGEMMNFPGVIAADANVLDKLELARKMGKPKNGHAPGLSGRALNAYLLPGIGSEHECTTGAEAWEKLAAGMHIMVREGSAAHNLMDLLPVINERTARRMMWCTDDRNPHDLLTLGHIDGIVRKAIQEGIDPIIAIQMATLNTAQYFGLTDLGAVSPGKKADFVILDDLNTLQIAQVYADGRLVSAQGKLTADVARPPTVPTPTAMHINPATIDFRVRAQGSRIRVIQTVPHQIITHTLVADALIVDGCVMADPKRDLAKIAVIERHHGTNQTAVGFISGLGIRRGAIASTVAHDSHNVVVAGFSDNDMRRAVEALHEMGGGLAVVADGCILARVSLPIAGLMSDRSMAEVRDQLSELHVAATQLGCGLADPFMTLSFMTLPVIPEIRITDQGIVDVNRFEIVSIFAQ
jgi:adenine deaminase